MLLEDFANQAHSPRHRLFDVAAQLRPYLEIAPYNTDQSKIFEMYAGSLGG